jgi:SAM-dependent methyltransferase
MRHVLRFLRFAMNCCTLLSGYLTYWTGKARSPLHPKHLIAKADPPWLSYVKADQVVLDIVVGTGWASRMGARKGARVVAVDRNERSMNRLSEKNGEQEGLTGNVQGVAADVPSYMALRAATDLNSFDGVLVLDTIEHLEDETTILQQVYKILKPGGWLGITFPNRDTTWKKRFRRFGAPWLSDNDHKKEHTLEEAMDLLARCGFEIAEGPKIIAYDTPLAGLIDLAGGFSLRLYAYLNRKKVAWARKRPAETTAGPSLRESRPGERLQLDSRAAHRLQTNFEQTK